MKAELVPLSGKYYGTKIKLYLSDTMFNELTIWDKECFIPSLRELEECGCTLENYEKDNMSDGHFESKISYDIACELKNRVNAFDTSKNNSIEIINKILTDNEKIQQKANKCYETISDAKKELEELRKFCKHEKTFETNYSWRVGCIQRAEVCKYCGELIKIL